MVYISDAERQHCLEPIGPLAQDVERVAVALVDLRTIRFAGYKNNYFDNGNAAKNAIA